MTSNTEDYKLVARLNLRGVAPAGWFSSRDDGYHQVAEDFESEPDTVPLYDAAAVIGAITALERELEEARAERDSYERQTLEKIELLFSIDDDLTAAEAKVARMGEALKPFASEAGRYGAYGDGSQRAWLNCTVADLRAARSALQSEKDRKGEE